MKAIKLTIITVLLSSVGSIAQVSWSIKAAGGTSWIIHPKVFLIDSNNSDNIWEVAPATNSGTFSLAAEVFVPLNDHWLFVPEINYTYLSGEISVTSVQQQAVARRLQSYNRLEIPLIFAVKSSDNFWFTFGPGFYLTLSDNRGFDKAVEDLTSATKVNSSRKLGLKARIGAARRLSDKLYISVRFDYDLGKRFDFEGDTYEVRMAMQSISIGLGWSLSK